MSTEEYREIKSLLLEQRAMLNMLIPTHSTVSYISSVTGRTRQTITAFVKANFEQGSDYWVESGKIMLSKTTTLTLLRKYNHER